MTANILNIVLNYLLIFGKFGFPELGVLGAGVATLLARTFMAFSFYLIFRKRSLFNPIMKFIRFSGYDKGTSRKLFSLGLPISIQMLLEVGAFALSGVMAGWIGVIALASHQIVWAWRV